MRTRADNNTRNDNNESRFGVHDKNVVGVRPIESAQRAC